MRDVCRYCQPALGASLAGDALLSWLVASGFLLVGLAPTSRARVSADALLAWLRLALRHLDAWRCRCGFAQHSLKALSMALQLGGSQGMARSGLSLAILIRIELGLDDLELHHRVSASVRERCSHRASGSCLQGTRSCRAFRLFTSQQTGPRRHTSHQRHVLVPLT